MPTMTLVELERAGTQAREAVNDARANRAGVRTALADLEAGLAVNGQGPDRPAMVAQREVLSRRFAAADQAVEKAERVVEGLASHLQRAREGQAVRTFEEAQKEVHRQQKTLAGLFSEAATLYADLLQTLEVIREAGGALTAAQARMAVAEIVLHPSRRTSVGPFRLHASLEGLDEGALTWLRDAMRSAAGIVPKKAD